MKKRGTWLIAILLAVPLALEGTQRIRYAIRNQNTSWLYFGIARPDQLHGFDRTYQDFDGYRKFAPDVRSFNGAVINSNGFRGEEFKIEKGKSYRVVALGGTTTYGASIRDGETYPEHLESELKRRKNGRRYEVINGGFISSGMSKIRNLFEKEIVELKPDAIIVSSSINDLHYSDNFLRRKQWWLKLAQKSLLFTTLAEKISFLKHNKHGEEYRSTAAEAVTRFSDDDRFWQTLKDHYENILKIAQKNNIQVVLVKDAIWLSSRNDGNKNYLSDSQLSPVYQRIHQLIDGLSAQYSNSRVVNAFDKFNRLEEKQLYFTDDHIYLREDGNQLLARLIAQKIE